ncbi:EMB2654 [Symbiodinium natans]|uniref:EMB2654 protein n=1 Tax=Symbiodinium natans TaxID=878477 RepID=A0A812R4K5_9DINO|nr:EMB2654 [Symbiodinium natans]
MSAAAPASPDLRLRGCTSAAARAGSQGRWGEALVLLSALETQLQANVISYNATLSALEKRGCWQKAAALGASLEVSKLQPSAVTLGTVLSSCSRAGQWARAEAVFCKVLYIAADCNLVVLNSAVNAHARAGRWRNASLMLSSARDLQLRTDSVTGNTVLGACEAGGWPAALALFTSFRRSQLPGTTTTLNTAISSAERGLQWPWSLQLFECSDQKDTITFNATLSAIEKSSEWPKALQLLDELEDSSLRKDVVALNSAISACEKGGRWQMALWLMQRLQEWKLEATVVTYNVKPNRQNMLQSKSCPSSNRKTSDLPAPTQAISACEKQKQVHQALMLLEELKEESYKGQQTVESLPCAVFLQSMVLTTNIPDPNFMKGPVDVH